MPDRKTIQSSDIPITGGAGHGPDKPINQAASTRDEEPAFAIQTPDAPSISPPGDVRTLELFERAGRQEDASADQQQKNVLRTQPKPIPEP